MVTYCKLCYRADSTSGYLSVTNCSHQTCCSNQVSYRINCFITKRHPLWICIGKEWKSMAWDFNLVQFSALQSTSSIALGKSIKTSVPFRSATTAAAWGLGQIEALGVRCFDVCKVPPSSKDAVDMKVSLLHGALASKGSAYLCSPRLRCVTAYSQIHLGANPPLATWSTGKFGLKLHMYSSWGTDYSQIDADCPVNGSG